MRKLFALLLLTGVYCAYGQYTVNGNATRDNCHCYTLTPDVTNQSGSVWNNFKIDLTNSFDFYFDINLGCRDADGADGMVFMLQPISTSIGSVGGGLGFSGISPSVGVTLDTWQNNEDNDPAFDHIAIQLNGNTGHADPNTNLAGPVAILAANNNAEDCQWHVLRIVWDAATKTLSAYVDGDLRLAVVKDFTNTVFGGDPNVFWGFSGSTGGARNQQRFCTSLTPAFKSLAAQKRCFGEPVTFTDSTVSFAPIMKMHWDFGDGSNIDSVNSSPVHAYAVPGNYMLTQTVTGADGCTEVNTQAVTIGSKPVAGFRYEDSCVSNNILFTDTSKAAVGTVNNRWWDFDNGATSTAAAFTTSYLTNGSKNIRLAVKTAEGCLSDTLEKPIYIYGRPVLDFSFTDSVCLGTAMNFTGIVVSSDEPVKSWKWDFGDNSSPATMQNTQHIFGTPGRHTVSAAATNTGDFGCMSIVPKDVYVLARPVAAFTTGNICQDAPAVLTDSSYSPDGIAITGWWWNTGNGQFSNDQNPDVVYNAPGTVTVRLAVQAGTCHSDTVLKQLIIYPTPAVNFGYTAACENMPVQFSDSSTVPIGAVVQWKWLYNNTAWSTEQNPLRSFTQGNQQVGLAAISDKGCADTTYKNFVITSKPLFDLHFNDSCKNEAVSFSGADRTGNIQQWQWDFGDNSTAAAKDTQHIYSNAGAYRVLLTVTAASGCIAADSSTIIIYGTNASVSADTVIAAANQPTPLYATGGMSYEWQPADGLNSNGISNPLATNSEDRLYVIKAYTPAGCETYDTVLVKVYNGPEIYVPSAFNPLSTAGNHIFRPVAVGISHFQYFNVYNRLGELVFATQNPQQGWDGSYKGKPAAAGTYVWIAAGITFHGMSISRRGTVILLR